MAGRHLDEGGLDPFGDGLRLGHQGTPDAAAADAGVHDQRHHPHDVVVVLESRDHLAGHEARAFAGGLGDPDGALALDVALEAPDDVGRTGGVPLVGEQARDPFGVVGTGVPEREGGAFDHHPMVPRRQGRGRARRAGSRLRRRLLARGSNHARRRLTRATAHVRAAHPRSGSPAPPSCTTSGTTTSVGLDGSRPAIAHSGPNGPAPSLALLPSLVRLARTPALIDAGTPTYRTAGPSL